MIPTATSPSDALPLLIPMAESSTVRSAEAAKGAEGNPSTSSAAAIGATSLPLTDTETVEPISAESSVMSPLAVAWNTAVFSSACRVLLPELVRSSVKTASKGPLKLPGSPASRVRSPNSGPAAVRLACAPSIPGKFGRFAVASIVAAPRSNRNCSTCKVSAGGHIDAGVDSKGQIG